jgi:hypothetical protein
MLSQRPLYKRLIYRFLKYLDNSVDIARGYELDGRGSIAGRGKVFSLFPNITSNVLVNEFQVLSA